MLHSLDKEKFFNFQKSLWEGSALCTGFSGGVIGFGGDFNALAPGPGWGLFGKKKFSRKRRAVSKPLTYFILGPTRIAFGGRYKQTSGQFSNFDTLFFGSFLARFGEDRKNIFHRQRDIVEYQAFLDFCLIP